MPEKVLLQQQQRSVKVDLQRAPAELSMRLRAAYHPCSRECSGEGARMAACDIGLIGLGVMGQNLTLNMADRGFRIAAYNRTASRTEEFVNGSEAKGKPVEPCLTVQDLVASVRRPRAIILMVPAGAATDQQIEALAPLLDEGDVILDGGNAHFGDTIRRERELGERRLMFLGTGISGGEEGARHGPSIMAGGTLQAYERVRPVFEAIAAEVDGEPCCALVGPDGAGHFVKMLHNGIEYADMQLIAEAYAVMKDALGLSYPEMQTIFGEWDRGDLDSYLIEITADILGRTDPETGQPLVEVVLDRAEQKGSGRWAVMAALELGVPAPTIAEAVNARSLSALKDERVRASRQLPGPEARPQRKGTSQLDALRDGLLAAKIGAYAQGFAVMAAASAAHDWKLDFGTVASIWRGGCIIRARFLGRIKEAYGREPGLANLLLDPYFAAHMERAQEGWREVVAEALRLGVPVPGFASALTYFDGYRQARLPANLLQAQRDHFGAHTYERVDRPGRFSRGKPVG
jgi:6-phosphogluconate dehydrogenase